MPLGKTYRFVVLNEVGAVLTGLTCTLEPWKLTSAGAMSYGTEINVAGLSTTIADDGSDASDTIDNSTNLHIGFVGTWSVTVGTNQSGTASIYIQHSTDGGTDWPSINTTATPDQIEGELLDVIQFSSETTRAGQFVYR